MSNNIWQIIYVGIVVLLMSSFTVGQCSPGDTEYIHRETSAAGLPIKSANCTAHFNDNSKISNLTDSSGYASFCYNMGLSLVNTTCVKPSTYNAILSASNCRKFVYYGNLQTMSFKLTNTLGEALEAQDCYVRVFYNYTSDPYLVEDLKTNLLYDNQTFLDKNGNYVRTAGVPITSSNGVYAISWPIRPRDEKGYILYRPNQTYVARADCNGKVVNCSFVVGNYEPMHFDEDVQWYADNMQVIIFGVVVLLLVWYFIIPAIKKGGFWAPGGGGD